MVKPRSIFINYAGGENSPVRAVGEIVGQSLERQDLDTGPVHRCRVFDVEIALFGDHGLEDDSGIEFSRYDYQLQLIAFDVGLRIPAFESLYEAISLFMAERLSDNLVCETVVVENLQRKVAVFRCPGSSNL